MKNSTKRLLTSIILFVFLVTLVNAEVKFLGTFERDVCVDLKQTCSNCTFVNISSVAYPNSTKAITNVEMDKDGTDYIFKFCNTSVSGEYLVNTVGDVDGIITAPPPYAFGINLMGEELTEAKATLYVVLLIATLLVFGLTIWGASVFPFEDKRDADGYILELNDFKYLKIFMWLLAYLELLFLMLLMRNLSGGFLIAGGFYQLFNVIFNILLVLLLPFFPLLIFFTVVVWINDKKLQDALRRGIPV